MLVMMENPSLELNVAGRTTAANCVISEACVTMWTKNGTLASALSQRDGSVAEKVKLLQEDRSTFTAPGTLPIGTLEPCSGPPSTSIEPARPFSACTAIAA